MIGQAWLTYVLAGSLAGLFAGLLGVGGGMIIVPALLISFAVLGVVPTQINHLALGTSLASIMFTALFSLRAHHQHQAVDWRIVKQITPGIVLGTLGGAGLASLLSTVWLKSIFVVFAYGVALQLFLNINPTPHRQLPGWKGLSAAGSIIGALSSLVGIGGGTMTVPFLMGCNVSMHRAVGTSAAVGLPIALGGTVGYILTGLAHQANLPPYTTGFVYWPACLGIACASMLTAPLGARLAHRLPVAVLKKVFALFLAIIATKMALS